MKIYKVGGAVRDGLLKRQPEDTDWVVVGASSTEMLELGFHQIGKDFPVFLHPESKEEYALARIERKISQGYTGFETLALKSVTLEEDLSRRDFTINAMALDDSGKIIDPYCGRNDLAKCLLRHVTDAFSDDPLRVLRGARFSAKLNFSIAGETMALMTKMVISDQLNELKEERVWLEFKRSLITDHPLNFFTVLADCGAVKKVFPELDSLFVKFNSELKTSFNSNAIKMIQLIEDKNLVERDPELIFSILVRAMFLHNKGDEKITCSQVDSFCERLKVPNSFKTMGRKACAISLIERKNESNLGEKVIDLLDRIDASRNGLELSKLLKLYQLELDTTGNLKKAYVSKEELSKIASAAKNIDKTEILKKKLSGKLFAEELNRKRIKLANNFLNSPPKSLAT